MRASPTPLDQIGMMNLARIERITDPGTRDMVRACHLGSQKAREWCDMMGIDWKSFAPMNSWRFIDIEEEL